MKDISKYDWNKIIPRMVTRSRKHMIFWNKTISKKRTRRFRCGDLPTRRDHQEAWQEIVDQTLRGSLFEGEVVIDMPTSALITIRAVPQTEMNRRRRSRLS